MFVLSRGAVLACFDAWPNDFRSEGFSFAF
jgi:hypothetical protein